MYVLQNVYLSVFGHVLHVSLYPGGSYLHVSQSVSARIPVRICTYFSPCLRVYPYGSARTPCISRFASARALFCFCICNLMHIRPNIGSAGQPKYHTHSCVHNHARNHVHCADFVLRLHARVLRYPQAAKEVLYLLLMICFV